MRNGPWGEETEQESCTTPPRAGAGKRKRCNVKRVEVESHAGYKADERPVRLKLGEEILEVVEVEDQWYSPGETYFRVVVANGDRYLLRHIEAQDLWSLEGYRSRAN
jgi:hypothetical protein